MTKLTTERLEQFIANPLGNPLYRTEQMDMARQLLAYEQAAEKPYGYLEPYDFPRTTATLYPEKDRYAVMPLYAAPVLPKQPDEITFEQAMLESYKLSPAEAYQKAWKAAIQSCAQHVIPEQQAVQLAPHVYRELVNDLRDVALEYHHGAGQLRERISRALSKAITATHPHPAQPVMAEQCEVSKKRLEVIGYGSVPASIDEQRSMARTLLSAQPVSEPYKLPDGYLLLPQVPTQAHLNSIAMRYRHDFYLLNDAQKKNAIAVARQMYEECSGQGFYTVQQPLHRRANNDHRNYSI